MITIPNSRYQKFTTAPGKMPEVVVNAWQKIWEMTSEVLGGNRKYQADFEVYDQRATDPNHTILDLYIGIH
jgi:predicted transcriptional regulator YdeE